MKFEIYGIKRIEITEKADMPDARRAAMFFRKKHGFWPEGVEADDGSFESIVGGCESCEKPVFESDDYQVDLEGDAYLCRSCWGNLG